MPGPVERLLPARLGTGFRWLLGSSWASNLGDGLALAAGPLLVARLSDSAFLVASAATVQWLPPLLFALPAGLLTDRVDRRRLVVAVSLVRVVVLAVLAAAVATGAVPVAVVLVALFASSVAEVFADNAATTLLPDLVARDDLAIGNARLQTAMVTLNQLAGPPLGAVLFGVAAVWPFAAQAVLVLAAAVLVSRLALPVRPPRPLVGVRHDLAEGLRWTWRHANVRTLVLTITTFNLTYGAAWSVLVLYATERLGLGPVGYGW